ncbi:hypothetical protein HD806DRAFT_528563 [Xylariaceae sp. AK1471]|nr:hypothetical protein HD806DRAFT_528563 [Xylariaceae sp. AK1471]
MKEALKRTTRRRLASHISRLSPVSVLRLIDLDMSVPEPTAPELTGPSISDSDVALTQVAGSAYSFLSGNLAGTFGAFMVYPIDALPVFPVHASRHEIVPNSREATLDYPGSKFPGRWSYVTVMLVDVDRLVKTRMQNQRGAGLRRRLLLDQDCCLPATTLTTFKFSTIPKPSFTETGGCTPSGSGTTTRKEAEGEEAGSDAEQEENKEKNAATLFFETGIVKAEIAETAAIQRDIPLHLAASRRRNKDVMEAIVKRMAKARLDFDTAKKYSDAAIVVRVVGSDIMDMRVLSTLRNATSDAFYMINDHPGILPGGLSPPNSEIPSPAKTSTLNSPRKRIPDKRFPVKVNIAPSPEEPMAQHRDITLEDAMVENKNFAQAVKIFEEEDAIKENADNEGNVGLMLDTAI